jgi:site-specific DNA recombinase
MWMNGKPPFGYKVKDRSLLIEEEEAELVRHIYRRYLELGSVHRLRDELQAEGARFRRWAAQGEGASGGRAIQRGALLHTLRNRHYRGQIVHRDQVYPGLHLPIVDADLFEAVQVSLRSKAVALRPTPKRPADLLLVGKLFDANGEMMSPSFGYGKGGKAYSYYIAMALKIGGRLDERDPARPRRVSAPMLDRAVCEHIRRLTGHHELGLQELRPAIHRVELRLRETHIVIDTNLVTVADAKLVWNGLRRRLEDGEQAFAEPNGQLRLVLRCYLQRRRGRTCLDSKAVRPSASGAHPGLVDALRSSHLELYELKSSPLSRPHDLRAAQSPKTHHRRQLARLPFLAPDCRSHSCRVRSRQDGACVGFLRLSCRWLGLINARSGETLAPAHRLSTQHRVIPVRVILA